MVGNPTIHRNSSFYFRSLFADQIFHALDELWQTRSFHTKVLLQNVVLRLDVICVIQLWRSTQTCCFSYWTNHCFSYDIPTVFHKPRVELWGLVKRCLTFIPLLLQHFQLGVEVALTFTVYKTQFQLLRIAKYILLELIDDSSRHAELLQLANNILSEMKEASQVDS